MLCPRYFVASALLSVLPLASLLQTAPLRADEPSKAETPEVTVKESAAAAPTIEGFEEMKLFTQVLQNIRQNYVDEEKVTYEKLINSALVGVLSDLDPHSQFMLPEVFERLQDSTNSTYDGIGITISTDDDSLQIITIREDGPAAREGLLPNDHILRIDGELVDDIGLAEAIQLLKGLPGESIELTVRRPATQKLHEFTVTREVLEAKSVVDVMMLDGKDSSPFKFGYARVLQFSEPTDTELIDALDSLEKQGMDAFILDLRNNPGGLLTTAINICGEFVDAGTVVLTTEGRPEQGNVKVFRTSARNKGRQREYPLAILINHGSASASEVVSGALQDLKRCIVIGETSFGKGSVQSVIPISKGRALRMTTAKYYTPSHRTIHENGVTPDIVATLTPKEEAQLMRWFRRSNLSAKEKKDLEKTFTDHQLVRAVDALKGAMLFQKAGQTASATASPRGEATEPASKEEQSGEAEAAE